MYIFAFRSRTQAMKLYDLLSGSGINCDIINTPREVSSSCGLSVRVSGEDGERAVSACEYYRLDTLVGVFVYGRGTYRRYR